MNNYYTDCSKKELLNIQCKRWTSNMKASVIIGIFREVVTMNEVMSVYNLSFEEIDSWFKEFRANGLFDIFYKTEGVLRNFIHKPA